MATHHSSRRAPLAATLALLFLLAFLPSGWSGWMSSVAGLAKLAIAPVTGPVYQTTRWLMGDAGSRDDVLMAQLERERDRFRTLYMQELQRNEDLRRSVEQIHPGALYSELPVSPLLRPVIGGSSDGRGGQLEVRAGSGQGVALNTVATAGGTQIVGKVVNVNAKTCWVRLITHGSEGNASGINGVVIGPDDKPAAQCMLYPFKGGLLQGKVEYTGDAKPSPEAGQVVRLIDPQWPKSAHMFVLGTITEVKRVAGGRQVIIVKPTVDLDRLSEVVLRLVPTDEERAAAPATAGAGDRRP